jgi:copper chaperone
MLTYRVDDMTCGHCATTITRAVRAVDAGANVQVDLARHLVTVEPTGAYAAELAEAITEAGYTPVPVEPAAATDPKAKKDGCCGCCS